MKRLLLILCLLCAPAYGETTQQECQNMMDNCIAIHGLSDICKRYLDCGALISVAQIEVVKKYGNTGNDGCPEQLKSKRQEYIEKCDKYLDLADRTRTSCFTDDCGVPNEMVYGQIATAYCTRALLEDK